MSILFSVLAFIVAVAGLFSYQWITFFPRLGIGYLYHIRRVNLGFGLTAGALALIAYALNPSWGQAIWLGIILILGMLAGFFRANRALVALDHPRHAAAAAAGLGESAPVLGFVGKDQSCAWPLAVLVPHHLVNDQIGGEAILAGW